MRATLAFVLALLLPYGNCNLMAQPTVEEQYRKSHVYDSASKNRQSGRSMVAADVFPLPAASEL